MVSCTSLLIRYLDVYEISAMMYLNLNIGVYQRYVAVLLQSRKVLNFLTVKIKTLRSSKHWGIPKQQFI